MSKTSAITKSGGDGPVERQLRLARMHAANPRLTYKQYAVQLGVDERTIKRDVAVLRESGQWIDAANVSVQNAVEGEVVQKTLDTYQTAIELIGEQRELIGILRDEVGFNGGECECCGRKPLRENPIAMQNVIKAYEAIEKHLRLAAQISGQLESTVIVQQQADSDVETVIRIVLQHDEKLARLIAQALVAEDARRQQRMLSSTQNMFIDAHYSQVQEELNEDEEPPGGNTGPGDEQDPYE